MSFVTLGVSDLERSRRFYETGMGLTIRPDCPPGVAFFDMSGTVLALWPRTELAADAGVDAAGNGFCGFALAHNLTTREAVDVVISAAASAGGKVVKPGTETFWGGYAGYFADPDGFLWEV